MPDALVIAGTAVAPGQRATIKIPVARRYTHAEIFLPTQVVCGRRPGPRLFVSAAVHGDEINGVEIIRRLLRHPALSRMRGSLLAVPVVNVYGFLNQSRYLPDRRDLNRSFPGSARGSLASRLADRFMTEIVGNATHGIDLHTGALHRANLPQIRGCLDDPETERLARAFGAPVILDSKLRDGSLRESARQRDIPILVYEAGEALRFDELAIRAGLRGIVAVMRAIDMLRPARKPAKGADPFVARSSSWVRAPESGVFRSGVRLGTRIQAGQGMGIVSDPVGDDEYRVEAPLSGVVIGESRMPLVNEGDPLFHLATFDRPASVARSVEAFHAELDPTADTDPSADIP